MSGARATGAPLRVASLAKQIPQPESLRMEGGRLVRAGVELEMNAYCRRAVAEGVTLATETGGSCTVVTLGPASAEDVLREAVAWGAGAGLHLCDPAFAGSDTLATARTLAAALRVTGPYDLVLLGRNSLDGETGQVGPELAQLLDLPFASGVRALVDLGDRLRLELEHDDGTQEVEIQLPAVLSVAERLCDPCKVDPEGRAAVPASRLRRLGPADLGPGPWGAAGSPTIVGEVHPMEHTRALVVLDGPVDEQVAAAVRLLDARGALDDVTAVAGTVPEPGRAERAGARIIAVLDEPGRGEVAVELVAAAARLGQEAGTTVHLLRPVGSGQAGDATAPGGIDLVVELAGSVVPEDVADALTAYAREERPWAILAPSTAFGREVAARVAAATGSGLVGDAVTLAVRDDVLVAGKPAFAGALVADITCRGTPQLATVRPGVLPVGASAAGTARRVPSVRREAGRRGRVRILGERRNDDVETLARAGVVIGVGTGVAPEEYEALSPLAALLGAELAATRKVTDKGWAPRSRQVGITGRSIAPRLYVALGLSGKFNHMVGVRAAGTILAVNGDRAAPVFEHCDIGIVGDWHEIVPLLQRALAGRLEPRRGAAVS
ncbi:MAG TPA: FAD-binding protein [Acidimicrobiales bacterium]|nr:FAD-binding protein [Acidimicrobiales bacterium]